MKNLLRVVAVLEALGLVGFAYFAVQEYIHNDYFRSFVQSGYFLEDPIVTIIPVLGAAVVGIALMDPPLPFKQWKEYLNVVLKLRTRRLETTSGEGAVSAPVTAPRGKGPVLEPSQAAGPTGVVPGTLTVSPVATPKSLTERIRNRIAAAQSSPRDTSAEKDLHTSPSAAVKVIQKSRAEWFVNKEEV